jgi:hypothetical protein
VVVYSAGVRDASPFGPFMLVGALAGGPLARVYLG